MLGDVVIVDQRKGCFRRAGPMTILTVFLQQWHDMFVEGHLCGGLAILGERDPAAVDGRFGHFHVAVGQHVLDGHLQIFSPGIGPLTAESELAIDPPAVSQPPLGINHDDLGGTRRADGASDASVKILDEREWRIVQHGMVGDFANGIVQSDVDRHELHAFVAVRFVQRHELRQIPLHDRAFECRKGQHVGLLLAEVGQFAGQIANVLERERGHLLADLRARLAGGLRDRLGGIRPGCRGRQHRQRDQRLARGLHVDTPIDQ